jgi:hypothetical protein
MTSVGVAGILLAVAVPAVAEHHAGQPPSTFQQKDVKVVEHKRQGTVVEYGAAAAPPEKPFPWRALGMALAAFLITTPFAVVYVRNTQKNLKDMKTVGRVTEGNKGSVKDKTAKAAKGEKPMEGGSEPRDRVWETMQSVSQWVPVDWVARTSGLSDDESADELSGLTSEGYLEQAKDKQGNPIFRTRPT